MRGKDLRGPTSDPFLGFGHSSLPGTRPQAFLGHHCPLGASFGKQFSPWPVPLIDLKEEVVGWAVLFLKTSPWAFPPASQVSAWVWLAAVASRRPRPCSWAQLGTCSHSEVAPFRVKAVVWDSAAHKSPEEVSGPQTLPHKVP